MNKCKKKIPSEAYCITSADHEMPILCQHWQSIGKRCSGDEMHVHVKFLQGQIIQQTPAWGMGQGFLFGLAWLDLG